MPHVRPCRLQGYARSPGAWPGSRGPVWRPLGPLTSPARAVTSFPPNRLGQQRDGSRSLITACCNTTHGNSEAQDQPLPARQPPLAPSAGPNPARALHPLWRDDSPAHDLQGLRSLPWPPGHGREQPEQLASGLRRAARSKTAGRREAVEVRAVSGRERLAARGGERLLSPIHTEAGERWARGARLTPAPSRLRAREGEHLDPS